MALIDRKVPDEIVGMTLLSHGHEINFLFWGLPYCSKDEESNTARQEKLGRCFKVGTTL